MGQPKIKFMGQPKIRQKKQQEEENPTKFVQQQVYQQQENFELFQVISQVLCIFCNEVERYLVIISNNQPLAFTQQFKNYQLYNKPETQELIERKMTLNLEELHTLVQQYNAETNKSLDLLQLVQKKDFIEWINAIHQNYNCKNSPYLQILLDLKNGNQNWIKTLIQSSQYQQQQQNQTKFTRSFEKRPENDKIKAVNKLVENYLKANQIAKGQHFIYKNFLKKKVVIKENQIKFELLQVISQVLDIFCNEVEQYLVIVSNNQPLALIERKMTLNLEKLHTLVQQYNAETNRSLDLLQLVQKKDFIEWINAIHQNYNCKNNPYLQILLDLKNGNQNWIKTLIQSSQYQQQQQNQTKFTRSFVKRPENDKIKAVSKLVENKRQIPMIQEQQQEEENQAEFVQQQVYQQRENFELLQVISQVMGIFCNEVERYLVIVSNNQPLAFTQQFKNYQLHNKHETQELIERKMTLNLEELHTLVQQYNAETNRSLDLLQLVQKKDFIEWINAIHQNYNCKNNPYLQILLDLKNGNQNWIKTLIQSSQYQQQQQNQTKFTRSFVKRPENDKIQAVNKLVENGCKANQIAKDWQKKQTKESPVLEMDGNKQKNTDLMQQNFL